MGRPSRIEYPGAIYYVAARGGNGGRVFEDNTDFETFLQVLEDVLQVYRWKCYAWCLLEGEYRMVVETPNGNLSLGMRQLNGVHTQRFNNRHGRTGSLFHGRYQAIVFQKDLYLADFCRYVLLSPVRCGLARRPEDYPWSSFETPEVGLRQPSLCDCGWIASRFGGEGEWAARRYANYIYDGLLCRFPWENLKMRCIFGDEDFLKEIRARGKSTGAGAAVEADERRAERPGLSALIPRGCLRDKRLRNEAITRARREFGYGLEEIARHTGLHASTVSRIANQ